MVAVASLKGTLMSPSVTPFAAALGAEVTGIDLRQPLEAVAVAAIRAAFDQQAHDRRAGDAVLMQRNRQGGHCRIKNA